MLNALGIVQVSSLAGIQYLGKSGISRSCLTALRRLVAWLERPTSARLLSSGGRHAFLFTFEIEGILVVKDGFGSGYSGEGPTALAAALLLLQAANWDLDEVDVTADLMERLSYSALTNSDIESTMANRPVRPQRWYDYIYDVSPIPGHASTVWQSLEPVLPLALLDPRLVPMARSLPEQPDKAILDGFRLLEDCVRSRARLDEHGTKLFQLAFGGDKSVLIWSRLSAIEDGPAEPIPSSEQNGRMQLFCGAFQAFRNPRAHHSPDDDCREAMRQFMVLNHLFLLEATAVDRVNPNNAA